MSDVDAVYEKAGLGHQLSAGERPAVVVVDFSCGFTDPNYPLGGDMSSYIEQSLRILEVARAKGLPVLFSSIAYDAGELDSELWIKKMPLLRELVMGSPQVQIDPRLDVQPGEPVIFKRGASSFFGTNLAGQLHARNVDTIIVVGATTSGCIRATVVDALQHQFLSIVPRECVADRHEAPHEANLFDIHAKYGQVTSTDEVLAYLETIPAAA